MGKKRKPKGIKKLTEEHVQILDNAWYQYDEDGSEFLDFGEVLTIMQTMHGEIPEEDVKELYDGMDDDGDQKVSYTEFHKHMEKMMKKHPLHTVNDMLGKLAVGPPGSQDWIKRDAVSEEEEKSLKGLQGVKYLLKPDMLAHLRKHHTPPKHAEAVCSAAMRLMEGPGTKVAWGSIQHWLKGGEDTIWKLSSFHKRIDVGQVPMKNCTVVREMIVGTPDAFRADRLEADVAGSDGKCLAQLANWVLICVRYYDAVRANMSMTLQNQAPGGIDGPSFAAAALPLRDAIPKALESFHVGTIPILYDPKGIAGEFLKYKKAKMLDAEDPRHLLKDTLNKHVCNCIGQGVPLVLDYGELLEHDKADLCKALEGVREGLYGELMAGKGKEEAFLRQLKGDDAALLQHPGSFGLYLLTRVQVVPEWIPEDGYSTIEVL